jgi:hypothetical protein
MRVFVPATLPMLAALQDSGRLDPSGGTGHAVTPALREWYAQADADELDYAALADAATGSLRLLAADPGAPCRRVVIAVDLPDATPDAGGGRSAVRLAAPVGLEQVVSVHVDDAEAEQTVRAAVDALDAAGAGDADAAAAVGEPEGFELLWFATQEIPDLVD